MDATKWENQNKLDLNQSLLEQGQKLAEKTAATAAAAVPSGFGADSAVANTPSTPEDKGTLTKFGSTGTGALKTMMVGEPIKTEPLP
jgi:hypothetical protein